jgi:hypothetical protein
VFVMLSESSNVVKFGVVVVSFKLDTRVYPKVSELAAWSENYK